MSAELMLGASGRRAGAIGHRGASSARGARVEAADGSSRIALACCLLIATAIPLAFDPRGYFIFLPIKWTVAAALVFAGLGSAVWRHGLRRTRFLWAWGALLAVLALASFAGIAPLTSLIGSGGRNLGLIAWLTFAGAFWLGATAGSGAGSADRVAFAAAAASIPVSLYAILQAAGVDPIAWREGIDLSRARSTLGNASFLGGYLVLVLPVAARLALDADRETPIRLLNGGAALLGLSALLATQTRGAWLGAATAAVLLVAAERRRLWVSTTRRGTAVAVVVVAAVLLLTPLGERAASIADPTKGTARGRLLTWSLTLELIAERPLLGRGPDTFALAFPSVIDARYEREVGRDTIPDRAHNALLDMAASAGVAGLAAYAVLLLMVVRASVRGLTGPPAVAGTAAGLAGYLVQQQFSFPLADLDTVFWLFVGVLVAAIAPSETLAPVPRLLAPALGAAAIVLGVWAARDVAADRHLRLALEMESAGMPEGALDHIDRAIALAPERGQYLQASARMRRRIGEAGGPPELFRDALDDLDRAKRLTPSPEFDLDRAGVLLAMAESTGDTGLAKRAESAYRSALDTDPNSARALLKLGVALALQGRTSDAERAWLTAASISPRSVGPRLNLAILYERAGDERRAIGQYLAVLKIDPGNAEARAALSRLGA